MPSISEGDISNFSAISFTEIDRSLNNSTISRTSSSVNIRTFGLLYALSHLDMKLCNLLRGQLHAPQRHPGCPLTCGHGKVLLAQAVTLAEKVEYRHS